MTPRRILIVRTDRLGDVMLTLPMATAIKVASGATRTPTVVGMLVSEYTAPIVTRAPHVDEVIAVGRDAGLRDLTQAIRRFRPDAVLFPNARARTAIAALLARVPVRVGTAYRWYGALYNKRIREHRKQASRNEAEHNLLMLRQIGLEVDLATAPSLQLHPQERSAADRFIEAALNGQPFIVLHAVSSGSSHAWPPERFAALATTLTERTDCRIVLTGTAADHAALEPHAAATGGTLPASTRDQPRAMGAPWNARSLAGTGTKARLSHV